MNLPKQFEQVERYVLRRLESELDPKLTFHNLQHTRDDVMPAAARFAEMSGINGDEFWLLKTAAALHDMGYLEQYERNEPVAARMAVEILPNYQFNEGQIELICGLIMATQMPQRPETMLQKIICDADLDSLGREDFWVRAMQLRTERENHGERFTLKEWMLLQHEFLTNHNYFTMAAKSQRNHGKQRNISELEDLFPAELTGSSVASKSE